MKPAARPPRLLVLILALTLAGQGFGVSHLGAAKHDDAHAPTAPTTADAGDLPHCHGHGARALDTDPEPRDTCEHGSCGICLCAGFQLPHLAAPNAVTTAALTHGFGTALAPGPKAPPVERLLRPPIA